MISPVRGSIGICPETNTNPLALIAWEYGPIAAGALSVCTLTFTVKEVLFLNKGGILAETLGERKSGTGLGCFVVWSLVFGFWFLVFVFDLRTLNLHGPNQNGERSDRLTCTNSWVS